MGEVREGPAPHEAAHVVVLERGVRHLLHLATGRPARRSVAQCYQRDLNSVRGHSDVGRHPGAGRGNRVDCPKWMPRVAVGDARYMLRSAMPEQLRPTTP